MNPTQNTKATIIKEKIGELVFLKLITSKYNTKRIKKEVIVVDIYKGSYSDYTKSSFKSLRERKTTQWIEPRNLNGQVTEHTHMHINIPQDG